jgi:hypothetical protein
VAGAVAPLAGLDVDLLADEADGERRAVELDIARFGLS